MAAIYQAVKEYVEQNIGIRGISIRSVCRIIGISRSGLTSWLHRKKSKQQSIRAKKEVGIFQDDQIDEYLDQLYVIDMVLYQFNSIFKLSGREILKMLEIEIVRQYAYLHQQSFNFEDCVDEIMIYLSKSLGQSFYDQYPDVEIETYIQCLNKVYSSVEFWTKEWGNDGYIEYIEKFIV